MKACRLGRFKQFHLFPQLFFPRILTVLSKIGKQFFLSERLFWHLVIPSNVEAPFPSSFPPLSPTFGTCFIRGCEETGIARGA